MKKTIVFVDHAPFIGGAQKVLLAHVKHLDRGSFRPVVVLDKGTNPELINGYQQSGVDYRLISFFRLKKYDPLILWRLAKVVLQLTKIAQDEHGDLIATNTARAHITGVLTAFLAGKKIVWFVRDYTFPKLIFWLLAWRVSHVVCVSRSIAHYYFGQKLPEKVSIIYVSSDINEHLADVTPQQIAAVKKELGLNDRSFVIGWVGRLVRWKGAQVLIEALKKLVGEYPQLVCVIVGQGASQEDDYEKELWRMVKGSHSQEHVVFTGFRSDIPVLLKCFDCFVLTSIEPEPYATSVVEAMMAGLAVIGTDLGGTPEVIVDQKTGLLVAPGDAESLAKAIVALFKNPRLRQYLAQNGQKQVLRYNREEQTTTRLTQIYSQLIS